MLRDEYRKLLEKYFGPALVFEETSNLEGLRIPHFYNAFYVYKYATGISASIALAKRVLTGGARERDDYFATLVVARDEDPAGALAVARYLGGPPVIRQAWSSDQADVTVVLGSDRSRLRLGP